MMMKKSLLTILCVLLSTMSWAQGTTAGDESAEAYAVLDAASGTSLTFYYDEQKTARGGMDIGPFNNSEDRPWNSNGGSITTVIFDESFANCTSLTSTAYWFYNCSSLTEIRGISNLNTSNVTDMRFMFSRCFDLTNLDVSNFNTGKVTDMSSMFADCSRLSSLDVSQFNTANVTNMSGMFSGAGLTTLNVSGFKTDNVTDMSSMFANLYYLTSLDVSQFNTANTTNMSFMFYGCSGIVTLDVTSFKTDNVTDMSLMFSSCSGLTNLDVSGFNTVKVTNMSQMFYGCKSLTTLDMSGFNTDNVTYMTRMLFGCSGLTAIYAGSEWSIANVVDGTAMFEDCTNLAGGAGTTYSQEHTDYTYAHIDGGTENPGYFTEKSSSYNEAYAVLVIDENNTASLTMYYDANRDAHREGQVIGLDEMMQNQAWMMYRENVTTVVFDSSFANCRPTSTAFWFAYCRSLTSIVGLQYLRTDETTNMSFMFNECSSLTSLDLSSLNTENVTNISGMLGGCRSLTSVDLSGFNTRQVTNMNSLFEQSAALTTINLSSFNTSQVTDMSYMFNECSALTTIYVGSDWSTEAVTNGTDMFNKCTNLVGGAGTTYSADHTDYTYARIDGGPNSSTPGYLTGDGTQSSVEAPVFAFDGDNLSMTTETANASIFYKMEELPTMDETYVDSVSNSMIVTPDGQQSTYYERPFELKKSAIVKAIAVIDTQAGTIASDTTTLVYDYAAWQNLLTAIEKGSEIYELAKDNSSVETSLKEDLQLALYEGNMLYRERAMMNSFEANHFTQRINELCAQIEAQMAAEDEPYAVLSTDGLTVTFYYDTQKNARGGIDINNSYLQEDMPSPYGTATTAVFDASFANYRPVSTAHWFQHCRSLTSITNIEYLNTVNVTEMTAMFHKCSSLSSLNLSNFNTSNVTDMTAMFGDCSGLTSLDLSNFNTTNVTGMNGMFAGCSGLTNIDLSNFNTTNVMDMSLMFHSCSGLTSLDLSNFNTAKVTNMESMFRYCSELKTIYIGNEWSTNAVEFGSEMFDGCTNLVGGAGTVYDANHTDHTYAHIDGGENTPGYFTDKNPVEASYYDHVLYVGGSVTLAEAMQKFGTNKVVETIAAIVWNSSQAISTSELQVITNPNLLIYVQDASLAPANRDNVVINGFAKNVVLSDVTSGNNNFYCPEEFTAEAISYTRNFQQQTEIGISRGWESIALPFDVQTIMHEKNGVLSPFGSSEGGKPFWLRQMSDNGLVQAIEIHANRPYLISMPNSTDYPAEFNQPGRVTFSSLNVRVPVTEEEAVAMADSTIVLIPTFQRMEQSDWIYALNVGETRAQYPEGSVFEQGLRAVRPFEAFTVHNNNQSNPAPRYIAINEIGNGTLGIDASLVNREEVNSEEWYSLDGRKLQGKPAQKGIYIQNGKKVIIK